MNTFIQVITYTATNFGRGYVAATAIIGGGKLWTILFDPQKKVHDLLGHVGTPEFRRQLAVGLGVNALCNSILTIANVKLLDGKPYEFVAQVIPVISCGLASLVACRMSHNDYLKIKYVVIAASVFAAMHYLVTSLGQKHQLN